MYTISDMFIDVSHYVDVKTTMVESCQTKTYHQVLYGFTLIDMPTSIAMRVKFSGDYYKNYTDYSLKNKYIDVILSNTNEYHFYYGGMQDLTEIISLFKLVYTT